ncbi:MAG: terminase family protein [Qipengyuania sp.]|jgi:phage terminase large subunit-like protein|nr:terminase family protein [Qipengyuania sp.]
MIDTILALSAGERAAVLGALDTADLRRLALLQAAPRPEQRPPPGDWRVWLALAGRGFGKTWMGAHWVCSLAAAHPGARIALVGATMAEARAVMVEGESGVLAVARAEARPRFDASLARLAWPGGASARLFSGANPDRLRGFQHHFAWCDELAKWARGEAAWDNLQLGLRLGACPRALVTTTPRPTPAIRRLFEDSAVARTGGRTIDNPLLPSAFRDAMVAEHGTTRFGRQELLGELVLDLEGALWTRDLIERGRGAPGTMRRIVVGVDPPAGEAGTCGIVVAGLDASGRGWVLADCSVSKASPERWARAVAAAAEGWRAQRVIAEANNGGAMVESVLRGADVAMPVRRVSASAGKAARAEPVAALFESGRAGFAGAFPALEDELCGLVPGGRYEGPGSSPDRADAMVWALGELMLGKAPAHPRARAL